MYWSVWADAGAGAEAAAEAERGGRIERAGMDGSARRVLVSGGLHWPAGLALWPAADELYWSVSSVFCGRPPMVINATT
jgi:hypothetical protein